MERQKRLVGSSSVLGSVAGRRGGVSKAHPQVHGCHINLSS